MGDLKHQLIAGLEAFVATLNEPFVLTVIATLVAAFAGAYGAQYISEKLKKKDLALKELRNTNAAIMASFVTCNTCISLKKQHGKKLKEDLDQVRSEALAHHKGVKNGEIPREVVFEFRANFQTVTPLTLPVKVLDKQVFEEISATGRALGLTIALNGAIQSLNAAITQRNELIQQFKRLRSAPHEVTVNLYFGFPDKEGNVDTTYIDSVNSIYEQTDDCIYFSSLLCEDLNEHGEKLKKALKNKRLKVSKPSFEDAENQGLMPDDSKYSDWLTMFQKHK